MDKLMSIYQQSSEVNKKIVHEKNYHHKMQSGDTTAQHICKVESLARQVEDAGKTISDTAVMKKV